MKAPYLIFVIILHEVLLDFVRFVLVRDCNQLFIVMFHFEFFQLIYVQIGQ